MPSSSNLSARTRRARSAVCACPSPPPRLAHRTAQPPPSSPQVRHIWQFVKGLPSACRSYASDLAEAAVAADEESPVVRYSAMLPRPAAAGAATCAVAHQVCVCGGSSSEGSCADSHQPRSAHAPYRGSREHPLYRPVIPGTSAPHDAACSALEARLAGLSASEKADKQVAADCKQQ
mmetsp:Transcript_26648/g.78233  ORF Transcript_26648/g.78233 Transcript_26648/m.78233 type:complete len:177 (-) Transcript_26648:283-813(-)